MLTFNKPKKALLTVQIVIERFALTLSVLIRLVNRRTAESDIVENGYKNHFGTKENDSHIRVILISVL